MTLPTEMTVGDRAYDILPILRGGEASVKGDVMVARAKEESANLDKEEGEYLLTHQGDIPATLRGKVVFVFTNWRHPVDPEFVACVRWVVSRWVQYRDLLDFDWDSRYWVLRRK